MQNFKDVGNRIKGFEKLISYKFDLWNELKKKINLNLVRVSVNKGDVWWSNIGQNVGVEIYGKNENFSRPVLIIRPIEGGKNAIGIPLTSQRHLGSWYSHFILNGRHEYAVLTQTRPIDTARLYQKLGEVPESVVNKVLQDYINYLLNKK